MDNEQASAIPQGQEESNFKKYFCTVTPLSKYVAMVLFVALPFLGFWYGVYVYKNNRQLLPDAGGVALRCNGEENKTMDVRNTECIIDLAPAGYTSREVLRNFALRVTDVSNLYFVTDSVPLDSFLLSRTSVLAEGEAQHIVLIDSFNVIVGTVGIRATDTDIFVLSSWRPTDMIVDAGLDYRYELPATGYYHVASFILKKYEQDSIPRDTSVRLFDGCIVEESLVMCNGVPASSIREVVIGQEQIEIINTIPTKGKG